MTHLGEVQLDRGGEQPDSGQGRRSGRTARWIVAAAIVGVLAGLVYFVWIARKPASQTQPQPTTATEVPVGRESTIEIPDEPLPPLAQSDSYIRRVVALLSEHPTLARWLASDALVERTALAVEQAGDGRAPSVPFQFARPSSRAATINRGQDLIIDPASHRRWDDVTAAVVSVDPQQAATLYRHVRPLFVEVYRGMGHPDGDFDRAIGRAAGRVLSTPIVQGPLVVEARRGYVEHRSGELRALPGISRQLLLMGPANVQRLQAWITRFLNAASIQPR